MIYYAVGGGRRRGERERLFVCYNGQLLGPHNCMIHGDLALDHTFGIHSHKTLDTAQPCHLLKAN